MDYKEKATVLRVCSSRKGERCSHCPAFGQGWNCMKNAMKDGANAITDLLARAEAAEARVRELETTFRIEKCDSGPECVELGKVRKALAVAMEVAETRAEKAEEIASELCDDFTDFVTGGVHNAAPYCANFRPECVNNRGWCNGDNKVCRGFLPKAAGIKKEE